jgi:hypothetical protein
MKFNDDETQNGNSVVSSDVKTPHVSTAVIQVADNERNEPNQ